jgi:hypothetical protein
MKCLRLLAEKCTAPHDYMEQPRQLLEARRRLQYEQMPVPSDWHDNYAKGLEDPDQFLESSQAKGELPLSDENQ